MHSCIKHLPSHELKQAIKIGTRDSQLAVWQATLVQNLLKQNGITSELVYVKSEGDLDTVTPLYELGVQGIFTKSLDAALLNNRIDIAVHSLKDVPTKPADGIRQAAVLERASYKDILIYKGDFRVVSSELGMVNGQWAMGNEQWAIGNEQLAIGNRQQATGNAKNEDSQLTIHYSPLTTHYSQLTTHHSPFTIATSSIRRMAQWFHRYPNHSVENLRGNVNTRLRKLNEHDWNGAIFAAAGLERIHLRPENSIDLDWMLPAPAQGAITIVCRSNDTFSFDVCNVFNDAGTELCTKIERDFLRALLGGCSTPISALAVIKNDTIIFKGNICSPDGKKRIDIKKEISLKNSNDLGTIAANELLENEEAQQIIYGIRNAKK
jgi:hydroxymethylbilane synthase